MSLRGQAKGMTPLIGTAAGLAPMMLALTVGGAITAQLREIAKGNDPKPMDETRFWMAAMLQGGGLGVLTDFIYASESKNGKSSQAAAFGPAGQAVADGYDLTAGNAVAIADSMRKGEDFNDAVEGANIGRDAVNVGRKWTPGANLWWARAIWNRDVMDNLQRLVDPGAEEDFARRSKSLDRMNGQGQWWPNGANLPERAPELATD